jgi:predicted RNA polymerase sigma factor
VRDLLREVIARLGDPTYELLERISPNPMVTLNRAVAVAMVRAPQAGLDLLRTLDGRSVADHHRVHATRAPARIAP